MLLIYENFICIKKNLSKRLPNIITTSMSFIAGIAWNDAFDTLISHYYPTGGTVGSYLFKFLYAFLITIIMIIIISIMIIITSEEISIDNKEDSLLI